MLSGADEVCREERWSYEQQGDGRVQSLPSGRFKPTDEYSPGNQDPCHSHTWANVQLTVTVYSGPSTLGLRASKSGDIAFSSG